MKINHIALLLLLLSIGLNSYVLAVNPKSVHPNWILQGNIYEVNVRQYTPEGTLKAFSTHLDRLKKMGVQTLWFMPINPISIKDRKGSMGSYYAVSDYKAINPEFGTMNDWKNLVNDIHSKDMKVIIDWVPNHTGADNKWLEEHPDFFVQDSLGNPVMAADWADTRQLNYKNPVMQDSMINAMKFWITETGIDGFRCDVAWNVPENFWIKCISELKKTKDIFMLAEGDSAYLPLSGFDAVYPWHFFKKIELIAKGVRPAYAIDSIINENKQLYPLNTIQMYFTSNHDENSWNKADYGSFPGKIHAPFAVLTQTLLNGVPLIYSGQEEPVLRAIQFFDKDTIGFQNLERENFYSALLHLRLNNIALGSNASFRKLDAGNKNAIYAFVRENAGKKVLVVLNLSNSEQIFKINDTTLFGKALNIFENKTVSISSKKNKIPAWGYFVFSY